MTKMPPWKYRHPLSSAAIKRATKYYPWRHFLLDDFLPNELYKKSRNALVNGVHDFRVKEGDPHKIQYCLLTERDLIKTFLSYEFQLLLECLTNCSLEFNDKNALQLRLMDVENPPFPRHLDYFDDGRRSYIAIFYLNDEWTPDHGGILKLHESGESPESESVAVEPLGNRLIVMPTDHKSWHSVEKVNFGHRFSILGEWFVE